MQCDVESQTDRASSVHLPSHIRLAWSNITFTTPSGTTILHDISGDLGSGKMLAVLGPSGAGKSTLLDVLSGRANTSNTSGTISINGSTSFNMRRVASYVEQNDALLGVLTVHETVDYSARLSHGRTISASSRKVLVDETLQSLGLSSVANNRIGTVIQRGISGGQKRRVTIACSVVSQPRILFLDEPTSGLDSMTSWEVMKSIKNLARERHMLVVCTIHQPNWETFALFDDILLLTAGHTVYHGPVLELSAYLAELGSPVAEHANPADHAISIVNTDFSAYAELSTDTNESADARIAQLAEKWASCSRTHRGHEPSDVSITKPESIMIGTYQDASQPGVRAQGFAHGVYGTWTLTERNFLNYRRNVLAYGIRLGMYIGMGLMLATIWVNLAQTDTRINDRLSVQFFSVAFLAFMSVSGIPAFLEERAVFVRERNNGLYGPGPYVLANSIVAAPFLFACSTFFALICYWAIGLHPGAGAFFRFLAFLFLAIYVAESQAVLIAALVPIFVAALAIAAFLNGFWMCVQGYFIRAVNLPRFWYYWAHWIDYQTFAFNLLANNDLRGIVFACSRLVDGSCHCSYPSSLMPAQCAVSGDDVLRSLDIINTNYGLYAGILIIIALVYRVLFYVTLVLRRR